MKNQRKRLKKFFIQSLTEICAQEEASATLAPMEALLNI